MKTNNNKVLKTTNTFLPVLAIATKSHGPSCTGRPRSLPRGLGQVPLLFAIVNMLQPLRARPLYYPRIGRLNQQVIAMAKQAKTVSTNNSNTASKVLIGPNVTQARLWAYINGAGGGNTANIYLHTLPNVTPSSPNPVPFVNMQRAGNRAAIFWAMVNGVPTSNGPSYSLQAFLAYSVKHGASGKACLDLLAALNGGFSASSRHYGTPYLKLVVGQPPKGQPKPAAKASKPRVRKAKAQQPAAPTAPASQPAPAPTAPASQPAAPNT
jgi:hypothetical protein